MMQPELKIVIRAVSQGAEDAVRKTEKSIRGGFGRGRAAVQAFNRELGNGSRALGLLSGRLQALIAGVGIVKLAQGFIATADSFEQMELKLDAITKGKGAETLERINQWALDMPVDTRKAVDAFTMMSAMGLDPTIDKMETLVDTASIFGDDAMQRVARALGQMQTLGKLSAEELNQLAEAGINARKYIEEAFGMTAEEVQKSGIAIEEVIDAIWKGLERDFGGAAAKTQDTWKGLMASMASYWTEFQRLVADAGLFEYVKQQLAGLLEQVKAWQDSGQLAEWAAKTGEAIKAVVEWIGKALKFLWDFREQLVWIGGAVLAVKTINGLATAFRATQAALDVLGMTKYMGNLLTAARNTGVLTAATTSLGSALLVAAMAVGAFFAGWQLGKLINDMKIFEGLQATVGDAVQYTFANIDKWLTKLRIKWLQIKKLTAEARTLGLADTSGIDKEIAAEERHLEVIERVKDSLLKKAAGQDRVRKATEEAAAAAEKVEPVKVAIDPDVKRQIDEARAALAGLAADTEKPRAATVAVEADTQKFREEIIQLEDGTWTNMFIPVAADTAPARQQVAETVEEVNRTEGRVRVSANTEQAVTALAHVREMLAAIRDKVVTVTVRQVTQEAHRLGGMVGLAAGGKLPGFGGGDRIRALLEAGEFVIRKEAVAKYGAALFAALNNLRLPAPEIMGMPAFAAGGPVGPVETMNLNLLAGGVSAPMTVVGNRQSLRAAVKGIEEELRKMGLSHSPTGRR